MISEFVCIWVDGRVIDVCMILDWMIGLGWEFSKVIEVCWCWEGELLCFVNYFGFLVMVVFDC